MKSRTWLLVIALSSLALLQPSVDTHADDPAAERPKRLLKTVKPKPVETASNDGAAPVPVEVARDRAKLLKGVFLATLNAMHHRYFHGDRAVVPARAMEDVFADMKRQYRVESSWIAVNLAAMSIDHEPETEFEKAAAKELDSGKQHFESIGDGYFRFAAPVPLSGGCARCHAGLSNRSTRKPLAGLVISIPVVGDEK